MNQLKFSSIIEAKLAHRKDEVILFRGPGGNGSTTLTTGRTPVSRMQTGCLSLGMGFV